MRKIVDIISLIIATPFVIMLWTLGIVARLLTWIINGILGEEVVEVEVGHRNEEEIEP